MGWNEVKTDTEVQKIKEGYVYAAFTDRVCLLKWPLSQKDEETIEQSFEQMLECRIFNEQMEYRMIRSAIKKDWKKHFIKDNAAEDDTEQYYTEKQYLDIDSTKTKITEEGLQLTTTGGGRFILPVNYDKKPVDIKVKIRNYLGYYEETGQAYVRDWRICGFEAVGEA